MTNEEISQVLLQIADLMAIKDENPFKVRSYRTAAEAIAASGATLAPETTLRQLQSIRGVGKSIAEKILELLKTGSCGYLEELKGELSESLLELLQIPTLGPKRIGALYNELGISSLAELEEAARSGKLRNLPGFGTTVEENILHGIEVARRHARRYLLDQAGEVAERIISILKKKCRIGQIEAAGSLRRGKETVGDLDILVTSDEPQAVMTAFIRMPEVAEVLAHGETKSSIVTVEGIQTDLRVVPEESFGAALQYFTGSQSHNIRMRTLARAKGLKVNEYGVFEEETNRRLGGVTEEEVYKSLELPWIPPPLREDAGEFDAAMNGQLPQLIQLEHIRGDLHLHTSDSDGSMNIEEAVNCAARLGYEYICISDHTKSLIVANGVDEEALLRQQEEIGDYNKRHPDGVRVLSGCEVNILSGGKPDISEEVLEKLDLVVASVHTGLAQSREKMMDRFLKAMENDNIDIVGHPSNRIIPRREESDLDIEALVEAAAKTGTALEINCWPERLDLSDTHLRAVKNKDFYLCINTDSHSIRHMVNLMKYGVITAQRGWVEPGRVINTWPLEELMKFLRK